MYKHNHFGGIVRRKTFKPSEREPWLRLKTRFLSSTEISCLFGCNPYMTTYKLYADKKSGDVNPINESERMFWGTTLQDAIARGFGARNKLKVKKLNSFIYDEGLRLGASFDFEIVGLARGPTLLEIKNVDSLQFSRKWEHDGHTVVEAPPHIELQCQTQMLVTGYSHLYLVAMVGGNELFWCHRTYDPEIGVEIVRRTNEFWKRIERGEPPPPDYSRDAETIIASFQNVDKDKIIDSRNDDALLDLAKQYVAAQREEKAIGTKKKELSARIFQRIGDAERAIMGGGFKLSAGMTQETTVSYTRKAYRPLRITAPKGDEE